MKGKTDKPQSLWKELYLKNLKSILSNNRYRIIAPFVFVFVAMMLLSYSAPFINSIPWVVNQVLVLLLLFIPFVWNLFYLARSLGQVISEATLNLSIYGLRKSIKEENKKGKNVRSLQVKMNRVRGDLKDFIASSSVIAPPIHHYELDRLQKTIDIFFNSASKVLFPYPHVFSRAQRIEQQQSLDYYESLEHPTPEEIAEENEEAQKAEMGIIEWFDFYALDESLDYLVNILFAPTKPYSPFSLRHSIDLIGLRGFFEHWNSVVASCKNSKREYKEAKEDIERYYEEVKKRRSEYRQRIRGLTDNILIVIISSLISIIVTYFIGR